MAAFCVSRLSKYKSSHDVRFRKSYEDMLRESPGFQNPNNVSHLATNMGIYKNSNSLMRGLRYLTSNMIKILDEICLLVPLNLNFRAGFPLKEMASQLRRDQNAKWAHSHVVEGIKYFKLEKFTEAFQCLNKALSIDAENDEGLVARGAL